MILVIVFSVKHSSITSSILHQPQQGVDRAVCLLSVETIFKLSAVTLPAYTELSKMVLSVALSVIPKDRNVFSYDTDNFEHLSNISLWHVRRILDTGYLEMFSRAFFDK